jgi:flagellar motor switch protein FliN/FliY
MSATFNRAIGAAIVEELAVVIGALMDTPAEAGQGAPVGGPQWVVELSVSGGATGSYSVSIDAEAASTMTAVIMGLDGQVPPGAVIDTLREICAQAVSAVSMKPVAGGATFEVGTLASVAESTPGEGWAVFAIAGDKLVTPITLVVWGDVTVAASAPAPAAILGEALPLSVRPAGRQTDPATDRLDVILDIDLPLTVRFGRTELPLKSLTALGPGSLIDLGRSADDSVEILVGNRVVAHGDVVIVSGNYGIRILDVVSPRDRIRSMEE